MKYRKLAVIGRGTAGAQAISHFYKKMPNCELEWHFDSNIPPQAVGEGSVLSLLPSMYHNIDFSYLDLKKVNGTVKTGIWKKGWGETGDFYFHDFPPPYVAMHFNAVDLQNFILDKLKDKIKIVEHNTKSEDIDADYIMDCSGRPSNFDNFNMSKYISVNSVHVTQCWWDYPRFDYTLTIARPYGWVFGIPLQNRCSIGYLYNNNINTLEEVKEDVKNIFEEFNLTPSDTTNSFSFNSYHREENFEHRVFYNGNASFFLEPLEATSVGVMDYINRLAFDVWNKRLYPSAANKMYTTSIEEIELMIMMHYFAGSPFKTDFWEYANERGIKCMEEVGKNNERFKLRCSILQKNKNMDTHKLYYYSEVQKIDEFGTWWIGSFQKNLQNLGIIDKLNNLLTKEN